MSVDIVKQNFERGLWSEAQVKLSVKAKIITKEEYKEITGKNYED